MSSWLGEVRGMGFSGVENTLSWCWEMNLGLLQEQQVLLILKPL